MRNLHKNWFVILSFIILSFTTAGCNGASNVAVVIETSSGTASSEANTEEVIVIDPLITKAGGLGDTKDIIEEVRGADENKKDAALSSYQKNTVLVMYTVDDVTKKNIANNVTLEFEGMDTKRRSKKEALVEVASIIPRDAVKVKEYVADESRDVVQYESVLLAERLKGYYDFAATIDSETKPGTFIVIYKHDTQGVYSVVVGPGNNP